MADAFENEAFSLLGVGVAIVALRTYARVSSVGVRNFMADDYLMLLAVVGRFCLQSHNPSMAQTDIIRLYMDWKPGQPTPSVPDTMVSRTTA